MTCQDIFMDIYMGIYMSSLEGSSTFNPRENRYWDCSKYQPGITSSTLCHNPFPLHNTSGTVLRVSKQNVPATD